MPWTVARKILAHVTPENEAACLETVRGRTVRAVDALLRAAHPSRAASRAPDTASGCVEGLGANSAKIDRARPPIQQNARYRNSKSRLELPIRRYSSQQRFGLYRWHIPDPVRFEEDLRVTIQALGWRAGPRYLPLQDDICSVAYWYQTLPTAPFPDLHDRDSLEVN